MKTEKTEFRHVDADATPTAGSLVSTITVALPLSPLDGPEFTFYVSMSKNQAAALMAALAVEVAK